MSSLPRIVNEKAVRALHPTRLMILRQLRRLPKVDIQLRKLRLTQVGANWKGTGLPRPAPDSPLYASYHALQRAAETLTDEDVSVAYQACARCIGAQLEEGDNRPVEIPRDLKLGDLLHLNDGDVAVVGSIDGHAHYFDDGCVAAQPRRNPSRNVWMPDGRSWRIPGRLWVVRVERVKRVKQKGQKR